MPVPTLVGQAVRYPHRSLKAYVTCCFDQVIDAVDLLPGRVQVQTALHHLDPQMVFLIDHQAEFLTGVNGHRPSPFGLRVLPADQLAFHQELAVDILQHGDVDVAEVSPLVDLLDPFAQHAFDLGAILIGALADEGELGQVACQANAAADHNVRLGTGPA